MKKITYLIVIILFLTSCATKKEASKIKVADYIKKEWCNEFENKIKLEIE